MRCRSAKGRRLPRCKGREPPLLTQAPIERTFRGSEHSLRRPFVELTDRSCSIRCRRHSCFRRFAWHASKPESAGQILVFAVLEAEHTVPLARTPYRDVIGSRPLCANLHATLPIALETMGEHPQRTRPWRRRRTLPRRFPQNSSACRENLQSRSTATLDQRRDEEAASSALEEVSGPSTTRTSSPAVS